MSETNNNILVLNFADSKIPEFKESRSKDWVQYGEDDNYPDHLVHLFNKSAKHNAIVTGKAHYIFGKGFEGAYGETKVNRYGETRNKIAKKSILDIELQGGFYWQIIPNAAGQIVERYHLDYAKCRRGKDGGFFYKKNGDWKDKKEPAIHFPAYEAGIAATSIFYYKEYRPGVEYYTLPGYIGCLNYIETDIEISKFHLSAIRNGMMPSKMIVFNNGEPSKEEKREINRQWKENFSGSENAGKFLLVFNQDPAKAPIVSDLSASELDKQFEILNKTCEQEIFTGHGVTSKSLFAIPEGGTKIGGGRNEIRDAYEIFTNTYVNSKQQAYEAIEQMFEPSEEAKITPTDPIGFEFSEQSLIQFAPKLWLWEKAGINPEEYPDEANTPIDGSLSPAGDTVVNEHVKNLTGRQQQQLERLIKKYTTGKLTKEAVTTLLKSSLALDDAAIASLLGLPAALKQHFAKVEDEILIDHFSEVGNPKSDFEVIKSKKVKFESNDDAEWHESATKVMFSLTQTEASILDLIKKDKRITSDVIAQTLNVNKTWVENKLKSLQQNGLLKVQEVTENDSKIQVRELTKPLSQITKGVEVETTEILIRYSYEGPQDSRNRPFCSQLLRLDRMYSRQEIESISEKVGYSVWDRRGGFWRHKDGDTTPYCRHNWQSNVVVKKASK